VTGRHRTMTDTEIEVFLLMALVFMRALARYAKLD
jgi:hypothetical protein